MGYQPQGSQQELIQLEITDLIATVLSLKDPKASLRRELVRRGQAKFPLAGGVYHALDEAQAQQLSNYKFAEQLWHHMNMESVQGRYDPQIVHELMITTSSYMQGN